MLRRTNDERTCVSGMDAFLECVATAILQSGDWDEFVQHLEHHTDSWIATEDRLDAEDVACIRNLRSRLMEIRKS